MIKVLRQIPPRKYKKSCYKCHSLLEYEDTDVLVEDFRDDFLQTTFKTYYIKCPICGTKLIINEKAIAW